MYVEQCASCHVDRPGPEYARSMHVAEGIRCGQCHKGAGHPDFKQPVQDGTCAGCHQPEYQQTVKSRHFVTRLQRALDGDRSARVALRGDGFVGATGTGKAFVGDIASGEAGGRLCAACHYDEHRLGLALVHRQDFCVGCHTGQQSHFPSPTPTPTNRCLECHVPEGKTVTGQMVNSHRFAKPGA